MKRPLHALCKAGKYCLSGFVVHLLFLNLTYAAASNDNNPLDKTGKFKSPEKAVIVK
ncbi:MAG: hypothetical protein WD426_06345 [Anditalea sp.]